MILFEGLDSTDARPVKFHGRAYTVWSRTQDDHTRMFERHHIVVLSIIGHVEIVGIGRKLRTEGIDLKHRRRDGKSFAQGSYLQAAFAGKLSDTLVRDAYLFQGQEPWC